MVCIPCFVIPFFLFIWYRYLQPIVLKFWNPWKPVKDNKTVVEEKRKEDEKNIVNDNNPPEKLKAT
ncbi:hypothetical protein R5R35_004938 [Gryllus longicercus]|uniref:Uncharacterized protein n=1 Tax=Gryllus longicercus TaxID=2509291 RepID=A0AAN9VVH9_9ORTH